MLPYSPNQGVKRSWQESGMSPPGSLLAGSMAGSGPAEGSSGPLTLRHRPVQPEEGDPLEDIDKLQYGPQLIDSESNLPNAIKKSPSSPKLDKLRWGTEQRSSGRSRTGLQIRVPDRLPPRPVAVNTLSGSLLSGPYLYDKSIVYLYSSSSSGGSISTNSFGAIGDHRSPCRGPSTAPITWNSPRSMSIQDLTTGSEVEHPTLKDLVDSSVPDFDQYKLVVAGEIGPLSQAITPYRVLPSQLPISAHRRRSTADLRETLVKNPDHIAMPSTVSDGPERRGPSSSEKISDSQVGTATAAGEEEEEIMTLGPPEIWQRNGPSFATLNRPASTRAIVTEGSSGGTDFQDRYDPQEFSLPYGSTVYSMKSNNIRNLQISLTKGIWTSSTGSNLVLANAWEKKRGDQKLILLFSIIHNPIHGRKYCGIAEMSGPYDPSATVEGWVDPRKGVHGVIPVRWLITKDVPFLLFQDLKYKDQPVTQVRHANTFPGETGRNVIQRYIEAPHASTAVIHPFAGTLQNTAPPSPYPQQQAPEHRPVGRGNFGAFQRGRGVFGRPFQRGGGGFQRGFGARGYRNTAPGCRGAGFGEQSSPGTASFHRPHPIQQNPSSAFRQQPSPGTANFNGPNTAHGQYGPTFRQYPSPVQVHLGGPGFPYAGQMQPQYRGFERGGQPYEQQNLGGRHGNEQMSRGHGYYRL